MLKSAASVIASSCLKLGGWSVVGDYPTRPSVIVIAPHTSNWDFFLFLALGLSWKRLGDVLWMGKHTIFVGPLKPLLMKLGGHPVNRSKTNNLIANIASLLRENPHLSYALAPEGTRKYTDQWKRGFLKIAQEAQRPLTLAFINFKDKEIGMGPTIDIDFEGDLDWTPLHDFYKKEWAKYPDKFSKMTFS